MLKPIAFVLAGLAVAAAGCRTTNNESDTKSPSTGSKIVDPEVTGALIVPNTQHKRYSAKYFDMVVNSADAKKMTKLAVRVDPAYSGVVATFYKNVTDPALNNDSYFVKQNVAMPTGSMIDSEFKKNDAMDILEQKQKRDSAKTPEEKAKFPEIAPLKPCHPKISRMAWLTFDNSGDLAAIKTIDFNNRSTLETHWARGTSNGFRVTIEIDRKKEPDCNYVGAQFQFKKDTSPMLNN